LTNPRYAGRAIYQGQTTGKNGTWKALIDPTEFDLVQARLSDPRRRTQVGTDRKHLGSGLYRCAVCGSRVRAWSGDRYRCPHACVNRSQKPVDAFVVAVMRARLARPDLADLLAVEEDPRTRERAAEVARLRQRLIKIEGDYDAGHIDGKRFAIATEKARAELATAEAALLRVTATGAAVMLRSADPVATFDAAPLMLQRAVVHALCTVRLYPAPRGRKTFDPETVKIAGAESQVRDINEVSTASVRLSNRMAPFYETAAIDIGSPNLTISGDGSRKVTLSVNIGESRMQRIISGVPVTLIGGPLRARCEPSVISVTVFGSKTDVNSLKSIDLTAMVEFHPGVHIATPNVKLPSDLSDRVTVRSVTPEKVRIR